MIEVTAENAETVARAAKNGILPGPAKSLAEAVCRVMEQVGYIQKDKRMTSGADYRYVSVEAVIDALRPEMIRQQLVLLPVGIKPMTLERVEGKNGGFQNRTQVEYTFELIHGPSDQSKPVVVIGEAMDVGDKSSNKAMTAARKYAMIMAFNIETGIDPDDTPSTSQERKADKKPEPAKKAAPMPELVVYAEKALRAAPTKLVVKEIVEQIDDDVKARRIDEAGANYLRPIVKDAFARLTKQPA